MPDPSEKIREPNLKERIEQYLDGYTFQVTPEFSALQLQALLPTRDREEYNRLNPGLLAKIDGHMDAHRITFLSGAYRSGKTSALTMLSERRGYTRYPLDPWSLKSEDGPMGALDAVSASGKGLLVDEFAGVLDDEVLLKSLITAHQKGVPLVFDVPLTVLTATTKRFEALGGLRWKSDYDVEIAKPLDDTTVRNYVGEKLGLPQDDKLVLVVTGLSGGSLMCAKGMLSELHYEFVGYTGLSKRSVPVAPVLSAGAQITKTLVATSRSYEQHATSWNYQREQMPKSDAALLNYIPDPKLFRLYE